MLHRARLAQLFFGGAPVQRRQIMEALNEMTMPSGTKVAAEAWWMDSYSSLGQRRSSARANANATATATAWRRPHRCGLRSMCLTTQDRNGPRMCGGFGEGFKSVFCCETLTKKDTSSSSSSQTASIVDYVYIYIYLYIYIYI